MTDIAVRLPATVRLRDGRLVPFDRDRIAHAIEMAWRAHHGAPYPDPIPLDHAAAIDGATDAVIVAISDAQPETIDIETIQDTVEQQLMRLGHSAVARRYILYRDARTRARASATIRLRDEADQLIVVNHAMIRSWIQDAANGAHEVEIDELEREVRAQLHDAMRLTDLDRAIVMAGRARIERDPSWNAFTTRAQLRAMYAQVTGRRLGVDEIGEHYVSVFERGIRQGIAAGILSPELASYDLDVLGHALRPERDLCFRYVGLQTVWDRYLIAIDGQRIELPQSFWMRVAMGVALAEEASQRTVRALEFYEALSEFRLCTSSPTLFNAGTNHPQLSSCFLTTVQDELDHIFSSLRNNALLSKWSGGLGNDWTNVRALGARIRGTNGSSQGLVPFLKVFNDAAIAVNQGGKRKGAVAAYLEVWHADILEFLDLRKNAGDDRRRTHDMHTAAWNPDLFMQRVAENGDWTLFSPDEVPGLHDAYGQAFARAYAGYEAAAARGEIASARTISAVDLWRRILGATYETGHPWLTFKDPSNIRSPQQHAGVVHNSNLCTEILLNTSREEIAVCNLASINLATHMTPQGLDENRLGDTVTTAMRMLDNVIDVNYYPVPEARAANQRHRPVGLGMMGFQDCLWQLGVSYASPEAVGFADRSTELIAWHATLASAILAAERGRYASYDGSHWSRGVLPIDSIALLDEARGTTVEVDRSVHRDWEPVRQAIRQHGMRHSNTMAIAPTATIANIQGVTQSIEPIFTNLFVKRNMGGEFTIINEHLVNALKERGLWDDDLLAELKYQDGSIARIERIPLELRQRFPTAFEIEPEWLIEAAARRQKWIDMGQSLNLYIEEPSGTRLSEMYTKAWASGLKTTYYLRSRGATHAEKSTIDINRFGIQPRWMTAVSPSAGVTVHRPDASPDDDLICDACQ